jgi:hypothetical protein
VVIDFASQYTETGKTTLQRFNTDIIELFAFEQEHTVMIRKSIWLAHHHAAKAVHTEQRPEYLIFF